MGNHQGTIGVTRLRQRSRDLKLVKLNPLWFKLRIVERIYKGDEPGVDYAYTSGYDLQQVIAQIQISLGPAVTVYGKSITYEDVLNEMVNKGRK